MTKRVACIGDSLTWGFSLPDPLWQSYPALLQERLGADYEVRNFGCNGASVRCDADLPYVDRSDVDYIALDKGDITNRKAVDILMTTMEEYINWGLDFIEEKMEDNPNYFFKDTAFLRIFLDFLPQYPAEPQDDIDSELGDDEMPESLD